MAKLGEGDARWIVTDRGDGKNVNSWHWEERDLSSVAHETLKQRFKDLKLCDSDLVVTVKELSDVSGDCTVAQRKGKIMCYFGLKLTLKWKASQNGGSTVEGKMVIEEVEHDNVGDDYEIAVTTTTNDKESEAAAAWVRSTGRKMVRATIKQYFDEVFKQHNVGQNISKTGGGGGGSSPPPQQSSPKPAAAPATAPKPATTTTTTTTTSSNTSFSWKMEWKIPAEELFSVLMNEQRASCYTRCQAKIDPRAGGTFEFLGGAISGYYVDVQSPNKITMQWRLSSWASGISSSVVMVLSREEASVTRLEFAQAGIPNGDLDRVQQGWKINFFEPIKMVFGYSMEFL